MVSQINHKQANRLKSKKNLRTTVACLQLILIQQSIFEHLKTFMNGIKNILTWLFTSEHMLLLRLILSGYLNGSILDFYLIVMVKQNKCPK
jgi:hypothetical protein